jgi:hypothetical protein
LIEGHSGSSTSLLHRWYALLRVPSEDHATGLQNVSRNRSWTWRRSPAFLIWPNSGEVRTAAFGLVVAANPALGMVKLTMLNTLVNSPRLQLDLLVNGENPEDAEIHIA